jgi:exoribonuclease R
MLPLIAINYMNYLDNLKDFENVYLIGRFSTSNTKIYGIKNKKKIYEVIPIDKKLPRFRIPYGGKKKGKLIVKFKISPEYLKKKIIDTKQLPIGQIVEVWNLTEVTTEYILRQHYQIFTKKYRPKLKPPNKTELFQELNELKPISIDPSNNCQDIDDALSYKYSYTGIYKKKKDGLQFNIHIAHPPYFLNENEIKNRISSITETLYPYDSNPIHLWGDQLTKLASLEPGVKKPALTLTIRFVKYRKYEIRSVKLVPSIITNYKALSYQEAEDDKDVQEMINITQQIDFKGSYNSNITNTKELVSLWMTFFNHYMGIHFKNLEIPIPYRHHQNKTKIKLNKNFLPLEINDAFNNRDLDSAEYSLTKFNHDTIKKDYYTHASSPIRRLTDCYVHLCVTYPKNNWINQEFIDKINQTNKRIKKYHKQMELLNLIDNINDKDITCIHIYQFKDNYCEGFNKQYGFLKFELIPKAFLNQCKISSSETHCTISYQDKIHQYKKGDILEISLKKKIGFLPWEKIIIEPNLGFNLKI